MSHSTKDAAIEVIRVGRDGIRFRFGAELHLPEGPDDPPYDPPRPPGESLQAEPSRWRITAASPPPTRDSQHWAWGLTLGAGGGESPVAFDPVGVGGPDWRTVGIGWTEVIPALDEPAAETIVLDKELPLAFEWGREMTFRNEPDPLGFLSVWYRQPFEYEPPLTSVGVNFYGEFTLAWRRPLSPGDWVALSADGFKPADRDSADFITQVEDCNVLNPPSWRP